MLALNGKAFVTLEPYVLKMSLAQQLKDLKELGLAPAVLEAAQLATIKAFQATGGPLRICFMRLIA